MLEPRRGGRIFECDSGGVEHLWGHITVWEPPTCLASTWHLGRSAGEATDVEITFQAHDDLTTKVRIEQRGWQRLGGGAGDLRERNRTGWSGLLPHYRDAAVANPAERLS